MFQLVRAPARKAGYSGSSSGPGEKFSQKLTILVTKFQLNEFFGKRNKKNLIEKLSHLLIEFLGIQTNSLVGNM